MFLDVTFRRFTTKHGGVIYKSSAPDRKIITYTPPPGGEALKEGVAYRVVILTDTDPDNPMEGQLIAELVPDDIHDFDVFEWGREALRRRDTAKLERATQEEEGERVAKLLQACVDHRAFYDPPYIDPSDEYYGAGHERENREAEYIVELRRRLRDNGAQALEHVIAYAQSGAVDVDRLTTCIRMVPYMATPALAGRIMNLFSLDTVMARPASSEVFRTIFTRIGSAHDADAILELFHAYKLKVGEYGDRYRTHAIATDFVRLFRALRVRASDQQEIAKIDHHISYLNKAARSPYGGTEITPLDFAGIQAGDAESFLHPGVQASMIEFIGGWRYFSGREHQHSAMLASMKRVMNALERYTETERLPSLMRFAYWELTLSACRGDSHENRREVLSIIPQLERMSGVRMEYTDFSMQIQDMYYSLLSDESFDPPALQFALNVKHLTGVRYEIAPELLQSAYMKLALDITERSRKGIHLLQEITGIEPNFEAIEPAIQQQYEDIILQAEGLTYQYHYGRQLQLDAAVRLLEATAIRPRIEASKMHARYKTWLRSPNLRMTDVIRLAAELTGIEPDFSLYKDAIHERYSRLREGIRKEIPNTPQDLIALRDVSGIESDFSEKQVVELIISLCRFSSMPNPIDVVRRVTSIRPDFTKHSGEMQHAYIALIRGMRTLGFYPTLERLKAFHNVVSAGFASTDAEFETLATELFDRARGDGHIAGLLEVDQYVPSPELMTCIVGKIIAYELPGTKSNLLASAFGKLKLLGSRARIDSLGSAVLKSAYSDPGQAVAILKNLNDDTLSREYPDEMSLIRSAIQHDPFFGALSRIANIQGFAQNVANDPWTSEFIPLLKELTSSGVVRVENKDDMAMLVSFVELVGMRNTPALFRFYADCQRHRNLDSLSGESLEECSEFGIEARRKSGGWRFKDSLELFNAVYKSLGTMQSTMLKDEIPGGIESSLGEELFSRLKGTTQFERGDSVSDILDAYRKTVRLRPALAKLPIGFQEASMDIPLARQAREKSKDQSEALSAFLVSQEVVDVYEPLAEAWGDAGLFSVLDLLDSAHHRLLDEENTLRSLLASAPEEIEIAIRDEGDLKKKQELIRKSKALQNPRGRIGIERQAGALKEMSKNIQTILDVLYESEQGEPDIVAALESMAELDGPISLAKDIRALSAVHALQTMESTNWGDVVATLALWRDDEPTAERIYGVHALSKDYIEEHYLHHFQDPDHTEHTPFSPALLEKLNQVWLQKLDPRTGYLPITALKRKLDDILGVGTSQPVKSVSVSLVPVSGLLHIFSGDLGDSCHTSRHREIAEGEYPNLRTWVYASNRGKDNEELRGSVLAIMAKSKESKVPVLVVRANNPTENFIRTLDADAFVLSSLKEAIATARRMRAERMRAGGSVTLWDSHAVVAIPMDMRGMASTNRQPINDVYRARFKHCRPMGLVRTNETTFNSYMVHDKRGDTPAVVIWEMDADGNETWHGDWTLQKTT